MKKERGPLLESLDEIEARSQDRDPRFGEILEVFATQGDAVLLLFLCLPFLQPIPLPGLSTPFGLLIALAALFQVMGKPLWVPESWKKKTLPRNSVRRTAEFFETIFEKLRRVLHPRLKWLLWRPWCYLNFLILAVSALLLALPLPIPFSNNIPAFGILLMALGQLEEDGLFVLFSYLVFVGTIAFFIAIGAGVEHTLDFVWG